MPTIFPEIRWAQRSSETDPAKNKLWITVAVPQLESFNVETTDTTFKFTGKDATRDYELELELFDEIDSKLTRQAKTQQSVVIELRKKKQQLEYWPRLAKDSKRRPFIRTDFDKWVDEDEQEEKPEEDPMAGMMGGMEGLGGLGGMEGLGGLGGLGGAGGAGGAGMPNMEQLQEMLKNAGGAEGAEGDSEDENDETTSQLGKSKD